MRVLLADDQVLFVGALRHLLAACGGFDVVGIAADGLEALARARDLRPDVILMDVHMPRCNGLEATRLIKAELPEVKIVMLTVSGEDEDLFEAIKSGASGYLLKNLDSEELTELLHGVARGEAPLSKGMATRILEEFARQAGGPQTAAAPDDGEVARSSLPQEEPAPPPSRRGSQLDELSERQLEVLTLVAQGLTYREIGSKLYLSERTVKYHMGQILDRLHLQHRAEAIAYAERMGLTAGKIQPPE